MFPAFVFLVCVFITNIYRLGHNEKALRVHFHLKRKKIDPTEGLQTLLAPGEADGSAIGREGKPRATLPGCDSGILCNRLRGHVLTHTHVCGGPGSFRLPRGSSLTPFLLPGHTLIPWALNEPAVLGGR